MKDDEKWIKRKAKKKKKKREGKRKRDTLMEKLIKANVSSPRFSRAISFFTFPFSCVFVFFLQLAEEDIFYRHVTITLCGASTPSRSNARVCRVILFKFVSL